MAKIKAGKPNYRNKAGGELKYGNVEKILGGPVCNNPERGMKASKGVSGSRKLLRVKK